MQQISEHIDLNDFICSPMIEVEFECEGEEVTKQIDVNDYEDITSIEVTLDFDVKDYIDEISDKDLISKMEDRGLLGKKEELYSNNDRKRFFCDLLGLNYHVSVENVIKKIILQIS